MRFLLSLTLVAICFGAAQAQAPSAPTMVSASCDTAYNGTSCSPTMNPSGVTTETRFELFRKITSGGSYIQVQELPAELKNTSTVIRMMDYYPGISPGDVVYYKVRACNASGCSADSGEVSATSQVEGQNYSGYTGADAYDVVPATPTGVTATNNSSTMNTITYTHADIGTWDAGGDRFLTNTLWKIYRKESSQSDIFYLEIGQDYNGSFEDREIDLNKTYQYAVRACRRVGCSVFAESSNVTTPSSYSAPVAALTASSTTVIPGEMFYVSASASTNVSDKPWGTYNQNLPYSISFGAGEDTVEVREWGYAYRTAGTKTITVTVYNPAGTSDTETLNITVLPESDAITTDSAHTCSTTASDTSACTTARHRPPAGSANAFHNAMAAASAQTKPLIELAKGQANEYTGQFTLWDRTGAGATSWLTIQPLDYATNFTAEKRVTIADAANLAWLKHNHADNTLGVISTAVYNPMTNPANPKAEHARIRGVGLRKANEATLLSVAMIYLSNGLSDCGAIVCSDPDSGLTPSVTLATAAKQTDHFILQHIYSDTSASTTNYLKSHVWVEADYVSILDSHLFGAKKLGDESYGIFIPGTSSDHVFDNNLVYGSTMAIFYDGTSTAMGPEGARSHSTTRRSHLTRLLSDQAAVDGSVNHKNMWETKGCRFCGVTSSVVSNWWNEDQQHMFTITNTNQVGYAPNNRNNFILLKNNVTRTTVNAGSGTGYVQLYNRDALVFCGFNCAGYSDKTSHVYLLNNLFYATAGITPPEFFINKGTFLGEPSSWILARHNTAITTTDRSIVINNGEQLGNVVFNGDTVLADNIFRGTIAGTTFGSNGVSAMTEYERRYWFRANAVYGALSADANYTPWAADEYYFPSPDSITGISFTDATNFDYRLSGSSAFRAGQSTDATDDTDVGVNVTTIKTALGGSSFLFTAGTTKAESGDWSGAAAPSTTPLIFKGLHQIRGRLTGQWP